MQYKNWTPNSWQDHTAKQMPTYEDQEELKKVCDQIKDFAPLIFAGEVLALRKELIEVSKGRAFLLQGGDCAESFHDQNGDSASQTFKVILQMSLVLTYAASRPVIKLGRIAGQYAKPRSADTETKNGITLPSYRGDIINAAEFTEKARKADPKRLLQAYSASAATLNLLRALAQGGFADLHQLHAWTTDFVRQSPQGKRYEELASHISKALDFMAACGFTSENNPQLKEVNFYTSHEALLLPYEEALTRPMPQMQQSIASLQKKHYASSAHMLWLGERTREIGSAHIEYLRGISNPIGIKIGSKATPEEIQKLLSEINPQKEEGRIILITRMGAGTIAEKLPPLLSAVKKSGQNVIWSCDPMHGNTITTEQGIKTREFEKIMQEVREFFAAHKNEGTQAGGLHIELTGQNVTECTGGGQNLKAEELAQGYKSACDPRLNGSQSLEMAFLVADLLKN